MPGGRRHGPADPDFPPPGGGWSRLELNGELVGWSERKNAGRELARQAAELGKVIAARRRAHLLARLDHKLRSAVLSLQEVARAAAHGRPELLESVYEQAQEVARRAAAMAAVAVDSKEPSRSVVVAAVLSPAPGTEVNLPADAIVTAPEPVLVDALTRAIEWMGGDGVNVSANRRGEWWRIEFRAARERRPLAVPELGEPLLRMLVDLQLGGWLDAAEPDRAGLYLRAVEL